MFDAADFSDLLPKKVLRWLCLGVLAFALLAPTRFQDWYLGQVQQHAEHLAGEFVDIMIPSSGPTADPTGTTDAP